MSTHLREVADGERQETTPLELFFDLVFVFAVTQLSHLLLDDLTWRGAGQTVFLLLVVWWAWSYTTWMTNWFDPESTTVRLVLLGAMLASLLMSISIPEAFGDRAMLFACAYTALQVGRNTFAYLAFPAGSVLRENFLRITLWSIAAGVLWIGGAAADGAWLTPLWLAALLVDYAGPAAGYWLPGRGKADTNDWAINPTQFAERFQLFIIIALGESIVVTGATASGLALDTATVLALIVAFVTTAALWWLYFDYVARIATLRLEAAEDPGALARDGYTYLHIPLVAGIIVSAVGDEIVIAHPLHHLSQVEAVVLVAGPAIYLVGHVLFRLRMAGSINRRRLVAAGLIVLSGALYPLVSALVISAIAAAILVALVWAENRGSVRGSVRESEMRLAAERNARQEAERRRARAAARAEGGP